MSRDPVAIVQDHEVGWHSILPLTQPNPKKLAAEFGVDRVLFIAKELHRTHYTQSRTAISPWPNDNDPRHGCGECTTKAVRVLALSKAFDERGDQ